MNTVIIYADIQGAIIGIVTFTVHLTAVRVFCEYAGFLSRFLTYVAGVGSVIAEIVPLAGAIGLGHVLTATTGAEFPVIGFASRPVQVGRGSRSIIPDPCTFFC